MKIPRSTLATENFGEKNVNSKDHKQFCLILRTSLDHASRKRVWIEKQQLVDLKMTLKRRGQTKLKAKMCGIVSVTEVSGYSARSECECFAPLLSHKKMAAK